MACKPKKDPCCPEKKEEKKKGCCPEKKEEKKEKKSCCK
jgi:hypothetical protein